MAYIQIPRDLSKVKEKFMFGLPKRQVVCFGIGVAIGAVFFYLTLGIADVTTAVVALVLCVMPFGFLGMYEKNGLHLEQIISYRIRAMLKPSVRPYKSENIYDTLRKQQIIDKEVKTYGYSENAKDKLVKAVKKADTIKIGKKDIRKKRH